MTRGRWLTGIALAALIGLGVWIARNTYWDWIDEVTPPRGAAAEDPYYSLERFARGIGVTSRQVPTLETLPPVHAVLIYGYSAEATGSTASLRALERWVEAGGRLLVPSTALFASKPLQSWSGVDPVKPQPASTGSATTQIVRPSECAFYAVQADGIDTGETMSECDAGRAFAYRGTARPRWSLGASTGFHALRLAIGKGTLAVVDREFVYDNQGLLQGDHARLLVELVPLRRGDALWIVNTQSAEPLLTLLWHAAAPAILAGLMAVGLTIWRNWPRFGPALPVPPRARRSLAEQLRAHARFAARTGRLGALRRAEARALDELARRRLAGYAAATPGERARALEGASHESAMLLAAALADRPDVGARDEASAILLLERARRAVLHLSPNRR